MKGSLYSIRKRCGSRHPHVVVDANRTQFKTVAISHSTTTGKHTNIKFKDNPNLNDNRDSYFQRKIVQDFKFRFSKAFKNYKLSNEDIDQLIEFLKSKRK